MERRKRQIPSGMQDTLPGECARKRQMDRDMDMMDQVWGRDEEDPASKKELDDKYGNPF